jgi:hypothetical protein
MEWKGVSARQRFALNYRYSPSTLKSAKQSKESKTKLHEVLQSVAKHLKKMSYRCLGSGACAGSLVTKSGEFATLKTYKFVLARFCSADDLDKIYGISSLAVECFYLILILLYVIDS